MDSYLGALSFSAAGGPKTLEDGVNDWVLVAVVAVAVGVGSLAAGLAGEGWEEVKREVEMDDAMRKMEEIYKKDGDEGGEGENGAAGEEDGWLKVPWGDDWAEVKVKIMKVVDR